MKMLLLVLLVLLAAQTIKHFKETEELEYEIFLLRVALEMEMEKECPPCNLNMVNEYNNLQKK